MFLVTVKTASTACRNIHQQTYSAQVTGADIQTETFHELSAVIFTKGEKMVKKIFVDYVPAKECKNTEAWFTCYKCGECGRVFENGFMTDSGGTHIDE